jgi:cell division protein FtsQ
MGLVILMAVVAIYAVYEPLEKLLERPLKSVVVEGEFHFISKTRATELIGREIDNNFLRLDLMHLKHVLLEDPWVESVSLVRRWPDTLVVKIMEQKPIARWDNGFLNQRGEIVRVKKIDQLQGLPWLRGNETDAVEILQQYQDLSQLLRARGLDILALKCDNKKSWRLTLKHNVEIVIGRDQVMEKMRRFITVYDTQLSHHWADVEAVDVRYSNGVAIRWVENSESAKKYLRGKLLPGAATITAPLVNGTH